MRFPRPRLPSWPSSLAAGVLPARAAGEPSGFRLGDRGVIERSHGPSGSGRWRGFPISVSLRDAPLPEVLRTFARLVGFNLILDSRVQGSVTAELKDVPWDQALSVILEVNGLAAEVDGRSWRVVPR
jgi:type IV pilus assembly protein PilQ